MNISKYSLSTPVVKDVARMRDNQVTHLFQMGETDPNMAAILPPKPQVAGQSRRFNETQAAIMCLLAELMRFDVKAPLAAKIARRVTEGSQRAPAVEQWSIIVTENGNVSTLPYDQAELRTGYISGSRFAFALVIDLKTYADRIEEAVASAPQVIGADHGE
tara:strand:+ start:295 stop:777 length:483 start_codon:yes stop_codon:yes gene_type:complete